MSVKILNQNMPVVDVAVDVLKKISIEHFHNCAIKMNNQKNRTDLLLFTLCYHFHMYKHVGIVTIAIHFVVYAYPIIRLFKCSIL